MELRRNLTPYWPSGRHLGYLPLLRMELLSKAIIDIEIFLQTIACMTFVVSPQVSTYLDRGPQFQLSPSTGKVRALSSPPFLVGYGLDLLRQIGQSLSSRPQAS